MLTNITLEAEVNREMLAERIRRAAAPRIPGSVHRHLLAKRLRRLADRLDS